MQDFHQAMLPAEEGCIFTAGGMPDQQQRRLRGYPMAAQSAAAVAGAAPVKCPRCESPNTKFCYYNNYNLSQPRHFCRSCRRYWTKGGVLRNVPVGGASRKSSSSSFKRTGGGGSAAKVEPRHIPGVGDYCSSARSSPNSFRELPAINSDIDPAPELQLSGFDSCLAGSAAAGTLCFGFSSDLSSGAAGDDDPAGMAPDPSIGDLMSPVPFPSSSRIGGGHLDWPALLDPTAFGLAGAVDQGGSCYWNHSSSNWDDEPDPALYMP